MTHKDKSNTEVVVILLNEDGGLSVVSGICLKNKATNRKKILDYEEVAKGLPQVEIPVHHHIHGEMYAREITIPKGTVITGQLYKFDHFDVMVDGDITVSTDTGETKRLTGFNLFKGMSGKKRAGYAHEDTRWITFHPFTGDSGEQIQSYITAETFDDLDAFNCDVNRADYYDFVDSIGMTQEEITEQVENNKDMLFDGLSGVYLNDSNIQGKGLFSSEKIDVGDVICPARVKDKRTIAGRYSNHALYSNAKIVMNDGGADLVCIRCIEEKEEITVNYRDVIKNRVIGGDLCQE